MTAPKHDGPVSGPIQDIAKLIPFPKLKTQHGIAAQGVVQEDVDIPLATVTQLHPPKPPVIRTMRDHVVQTINDLEKLQISGYVVKVDVQDSDMLVRPFFSARNDSIKPAKNYNVSIEKDGVKTSVLDFKIAGDDFTVHARAGMDSGKRILKGTFSGATQNGAPIPVNQQGETLDVVIKHAARDQIESTIHDLTPL